MVLLCESHSLLLPGVFFALDIQVRNSARLCSLWNVMCRPLVDVLDDTFMQGSSVFETIGRPGLVKGAWSVEEDENLVTLIGLGFSTWSELASHTPGRTAKQCRERWCHHLDPSVNHGNWSQEEDRQLKTLQVRMGIFGHAVHVTLMTLFDGLCLGFQQSEATTTSKKMQRHERLQDKTG